MILCENLSRYFSSFIAVQSLNLEIPRGAVCALVGPNGAGKSTTMKMLCTLLSPSRGRAFIGGRDVTSDAINVRRLIGYLPEAFQLYEDMTVEHYLRFFGRAYALSDEIASARTYDFLKRLGLEEKKNVKVGTLSRGMRQRLGVAKSFLHDPEVVFLDEPASGLDPVARTELRDFLRYQQHLGKTVVISSHVLKELSDFCDHIAIIQKGRLVEFGPLTGTGGVLERYAQTHAGGRRFTARVVKDAPRFELFLNEQPGVSNVERRDDSLSFELDGDDSAAGILFTAIAKAGFALAKYAPDEIDLEHVYRKAGGTSER